MPMTATATSVLSRLHTTRSFTTTSRKTMAVAPDSPRQTAKKSLRQHLKSTLSSLPQEKVTSQSRAAQNTILKLPQFRSASRIGIYLSMPNGEAQTDILVRNALNSGKKVFVPYIYTLPGSERPRRKVMDMLRLKDLREYEGLEKDGWGIPKLGKEEREVRENAGGGKGLELLEGEKMEGEVEGLDLIVVPGVAFDEEMNRLGHGAGFYDMFLTRFCEDGRRKKPFLVGLCLAEQILPPGQLVVQEWDWKVDAVAVGDGRLLTSKDTQ